MVDAIHLFRKVNAVLPNIRLLRFQLAYALYQDKQFKAAKNELEKLRSSLTDPKEIESINQYIRAVRRNERWNHCLLRFLKWRYRRPIITSAVGTP